MRSAVLLKAEQIARMRVQGVPATKIALEMGMSYDGLLRILRTEEYLQIEQDVSGRLLGKMDARLDRRADMRQQVQEEVEDAVPEAMRLIINNLRKKQDLKSALEILERDPKRQFARGTVGTPMQQQAAQVRPPIDRGVLQTAMADADLTHEQLDKIATSSKPASA